MMPRFNPREPLDAPPSMARRYFAAENRVICDLSGCAYLVCTIEKTIGDPGFMATVLADALNQHPALST